MKGENGEENRRKSKKISAKRLAWRRRYGEKLRCRNENNQWRNGVISKKSIEKNLAASLSWRESVNSNGEMKGEISNIET